MGFLGDTFNAITGQQSVPQQTFIPINEQLNNAYSTATGQIPNFAAYNNALQPVETGLQLNNQSQIFGPAANQLQKNTYQSILDQINLGSQLPADVQQQVIQNALQGSAASGFGVSPGGRGLVAKDLGLTSLDLLNQRQAAALGAVNQLPSSHYQYTPQGQAGIDVGGILNAQSAYQAQQDNYANLQENIRQKNFSNLLNTGGKILGTVAGGIFGGAAGAQIGGQIGGSLVQGGGVAGYDQQQSGGGGGGFSSLLSLFGNHKGGGSYGNGSGGFFGFGANQYDQGADQGVGTYFG